MADYTLDAQKLQSKLDKEKQKNTQKLEHIQKTINNLKQDYSNPEYIKAVKEQAHITQILDDIEQTYKLIQDYKTAQKLLDDTSLTQDMIELAQQEMQEIVGKIQDAQKRIFEQEQTYNNFIIEIRAGAGGEEAALFAKDLFRMYQLYLESKGIKVQITDISYAEQGGYKFISAYVQGKGAYQLVKYESGVHRVQRVPTTESSGRIHTSTASVAILPDIDPDKIQIHIDPNDLEIERIRASGPGGQNVNKVSTAIRIKHIPTGIIVTSQQSRSQSANKEYAFKILRAKLYQMEQQKIIDKLSSARRAQIGNQDRSEKIRTYNFPQNRVTDHRIKKSWYNLDAIMEGKLDDMLTTVNTMLDQMYADQDQN